MANYRKWKPGVEQIIIDNYATMSTDDIVKLINDPDITRNVVFNKAGSLGLKKNKNLVALRATKNFSETMKVISKRLDAPNTADDLLKIEIKAKFAPCPPEPVFEEETDEEYYVSLMFDDVKKGVLVRKHTGQSY